MNSVVLLLAIIIFQADASVKDSCTYNEYGSGRCAGWNDANWIYDSSSMPDGNANDRGTVLATEALCKASCETHRCTFYTYNPSNDWCYLWKRATCTATSYSTYVIKKRTCVGYFSQLSGNGWCQNSAGSEGTARKFLEKGTLASVSGMCHADSQCAGFAGPTTAGRWVLYTTNGCTDGCSNTAWSSNSLELYMAGHSLSSQGMAWTTASCYRNKKLVRCPRRSFNGVNAYLDCNSQIYEGTCTARCNLGWTGQERRYKCAANGNFSKDPDAILCSRISCPKSTFSVPNAELDCDSQLYEGTCSATCTDGFKSDEIHYTYRCESDGSFAAVSQQISCRRRRSWVGDYNREAGTHASLQQFASQPNLSKPVKMIAEFLLENKLFGGFSYADSTGTQGFWNFPADGRARVASVTKPLIAAIAVKHFSRTDTIGQVLPSLATSKVSHITIEQLISHESGITQVNIKPLWPEYCGFPSLNGGISWSEYKAKFSSLKLDTTGKEVYCNLNYIILGNLLAENGVDVEREIQLLTSDNVNFADDVFALENEVTSFVGNERLGNKRLYKIESTRYAGGLVSSMKDLLDFGQKYVLYGRNAGQLIGSQVDGWKNNHDGYLPGSRSSLSNMVKDGGVIAFAINFRQTQVLDSSNFGTSMEDKYIDLNEELKNYFLRDWRGKFEKLSGNGYCQNANGGEGTARKFISGSKIDEALDMCLGDSECAGFAGPNSNNQWIVYTTTGCTDGCTENSWSENPQEIQKAGFGGQGAWSNAKCYRKKLGMISCGDIDGSGSRYNCGPKYLFNPSASAVSSPDKSKCCTQKFEKLSGNGYCQNANGGEGTARKLISGSKIDHSYDEALDMCLGDSECAGFAGPTSNNQWIVYTTTGCTDGCTEKSWSENPQEIQKAGFGGQEAWSNAKCYRKNPEKFEKLSGNGWCQNANGGEGTARKFISGIVAEAALNMCLGDSECAGFAGPTSNNQWIVYTTTGCTDGCTEKSWSKNPQGIQKAGFGCKGQVWSNAKCYRKKPTR